MTRLVLYDGVCGFCNGAVRWLMRRDADGRFRFAPLQGDTAADLRARHPEIPEEYDTVAYVEMDGGVERVYLRSEAVFRIAAQLGAPWSWCAALRHLPRGLTDLGYALFARVRYRVFGRLDRCPIPSPDQRERFLA